MNLPAITIIGDVDSGKSTLIGQLLIATESVPSQLIEKVKEFCAGQGIEFEPAYLVDYIREEREEKSTREWALCNLKIGGRDITLIDTPGQAILSKRMVSGLTQASVAALLLDASDISPKKISHYKKLIEFLNLPDFIIVVNKMDLIGFEQKQYENILKYLRSEFGHEISIIPISALASENILPSKKIEWHQGNTLLGVLEEKLRGEKAAESKHFIFPVQDVFERGGERVIFGEALLGKVKVGDELIYMEAAAEKRSVVVKEIFHLDEKQKTLSFFENGGLVLGEPVEARRGDILLTDASSLKLKKKIKARLFSVEPFSASQKLVLRYLKQSIEVDQLDFTGEDIQLQGKAEIPPNAFIEAKIELATNAAFLSQSLGLPEAGRILLENSAGEMVAIGSIDED